ncbi:MAG: hypothetical protein PHD01_15200 [Geobacteraceae bacterium]|nr:hypothetical protein [Geobacteraceae bacterium]
MTGKAAKGSEGLDNGIKAGNALSKMPPWQLDIGATVLGDDKVRFRVWAPQADGMSVRIVSAAETRLVSLRRETR